VADGFGEGAPRALGHTQQHSHRLRAISDARVVFIHVAAENEHGALRLSIKWRLNESLRESVAPDSASGESAAAAWALKN
jgi:hypothetical protein